MSSISATVVAPAPKLRSRPVNTSYAPVSGVKAAATGASVAKSRPARVTSTTSSEWRSRSAAVSPAASVIRRTGPAVKCAEPHLSLTAASDLRQPRPDSRSGTTVPAAVSTNSTGDAVALLRPAVARVSPVSARGVRSASATAPPRVAGTPAAAAQPTRVSARMDSTSSSMRGSSSDAGSTRRRQRPPVVPRVDSLLSNAPLMHSTTADTMPIRRSCTAATVMTAASAPGSQLCSRTPSVYEAAAPVSPCCTAAPVTHTAPPLPPPLPLPLPVPVRHYASAPTSRVSSVNSRLTDGGARHTRKPPQRPRTGAVRLIVTRRGGSGAAATAETATPCATTTALVASRGTTDYAAMAATSAADVPPRHAGARPLLSANRSLAARSAPAGGGGRPPQRSRHPSAHSIAGAVEAEVRTPRGGTVAANGASARGPSRHDAVRERQPQPQPLSARRGAAVPPARKATRKPRSSDAATAAAAGGAAPFQHTHTDCPPPLSFAGVARGPTANAASRGPVSPIKRTSTACPSTAQRYPASAADEPVRGAGGPPGSPVTDSAFASPWIRPGMLSTPTNRDGGRDTSEAPTIPYDGSTGRRGSLTLSPRTDFDSLSVSGRLSYGL
ncbi:hypothetical protein NESM_000143000 [Novymonas esmeraldas]|uniref:Uncharacterized protein n=1 Tax=Novymonas esmeraldas TaxID=1808958 RepID=A0AAW0F2P2_9TRYP